MFRYKKDEEVIKSLFVYSLTYHINMIGFLFSSKNAIEKMAGLITCHF